LISARASKALDVNIKVDREGATRGAVISARASKALDDVVLCEGE
jgi:hypothetical protein